MNRQSFKYLMQDSIQGIKRNPGSSIASVFLAGVALLLVGVLLAARIFAADAISYVESQLSMKVYLDETMDATEVAALLKEQGFAESTAVETGEEQLETLAFLFNGKEHLMKAFADGGMHDAVKLEVAEKSEMAFIAEELSAVSGVEQVIYPQQMAAALDSFITGFEQYGFAIVLFFLAIAFLMIYMTFHLALYKRKLELEVKLFVGMDPKAVRAQFLAEGALLSLAGAAAAIILTAVFHLFVLEPLHRAMPFWGQTASGELWIVASIQVLIALLMGLAASCLATRKVIAGG